MSRLFDDRIHGDIAEQRDFFPIRGRHFAFGAANQDIWLDTDLSELPDRVLGRFGLQFRRRLQVGHQCQVNVQAIFFADIQRKLPNRFQERLAFDVADGSADFGDHDIDFVAAQLADAAS